MSQLSEVVLELTNWCPLNCRHCSSSSGPVQASGLSEGAVLRLLDEAKSLGASQISFGGGEPTSCSLFPTALGRACSLGLGCEIYTCGVIRFVDKLGPLPERLVATAAAMNSVKFIFSIHGPRAELHDYITQSPGSFDCLVASLRAAVACGIHCEANFVPVRPNVQTLRDVVTLASACGAQRLSILRFVPQGRGLLNQGELECTWEEERAFVEDLLDLRRTSPIELRTGSPFNGIIPGNCVACRAGWAKLVVQPNGNVLPCEVFKHRERCDWGLSVYNLSLREVIAAQQLIALRKGLQEGADGVCPVHRVLRLMQQKSGVHREALEGAISR